MLNAMGMSSQKSISPGYLTRHTAQQRDFEAKVIQTGSGLNDLAESLNEIETFELIAVGYSSVFSIPLYAMESFVWYGYFIVFVDTFYEHLMVVIGSKS